MLNRPKFLLNQPTYLSRLSLHLPVLRPVPSIPHVPISSSSAPFQPPVSVSTPRTYRVMCEENFKRVPENSSKELLLILTHLAQM